MNDNSSNSRLEDKDQFKEFVDSFYNTREKALVNGIYEVLRDTSGELIAVRMLTLNFNEAHGTLAVLMDVAGIEFGEADIIEAVLSDEEVKEAIFSRFYPFLDDEKKHPNIEALRFGFDNKKELGFIAVRSEEVLKNYSAFGITDAHLRLCLLSRRCHKPREINFDGCFGKLPNLVYTTGSAYTVNDWNDKWYNLIAKGEYPIAVDRFPPLAWSNPFPTGVRIANVDMIRSGAHLAEGTTVMHYGFVNFNAGTLGKSMVEGRISSKTVIDDGTDVGAGSGCLGTLSGGNETLISTGKNCLIGAMAECGIPLGDNVCIAAGVVFTGNTPVKVIAWIKDNEGKILTDRDGKPIIDEENTKVMKAKCLSEVDNITFRRNSIDGSIEVIPLANGVRLNDILHSN